MNGTEKEMLKGLIDQCKSELLNHVLQDDAVSSHIKKIKVNLDQCSEILQRNWVTKADSVKTSSRSRLPGNERSNMLIVACAMSRWDYPLINKIAGREFNQSEAFDYLAEKLGVKVNTIKNYRDTFDSHVEQMRSHRQGWKKDLNDEQLKIKEKCGSKTEQEMIEVLKSILEG